MYCNAIGKHIYRYICFSETRAGNNLYQELSFTDNDALADIDEGADLTGKLEAHAHRVFKKFPRKIII